MPLATHASYLWNSPPAHPSSVSPKGFFDVPCPNRWAPQGARKGHVALRTLQTGLTNSWPMRHPAVRQGMKTAWHLRPSAVALAIAPLLLAGCAELGEFRMDIARLRADLHANTQTFSQLSVRVDESEKRPQFGHDSGRGATHAWGAHQY